MRAKGAEGGRHRRRLAPARGRARAREDGDLVEHDRDVLDEAAVGKRLVRLDPNDGQAQVFEEPLVRGVLRDRTRIVDGRALEERQLAAGDGGGDASGDGDVTSASRVGHGRGRLCLRQAAG